MQVKKCLQRIAACIEEQLLDLSEKEQVDLYCFLHDLCQVPGFENYVGFLTQCRKPSIEISQHLLDLKRIKTPAGMGLLTGYAGEGMLRLTDINHIDNSWTRLL